MSHTIKMLERLAQSRIRKEVSISMVFTPRESSIHGLFAVRVPMEKYREGQKLLHCFLFFFCIGRDTQKGTVWYCMRKSGVAEGFVTTAQDTYESS